MVGGLPPGMAEVRSWLPFFQPKAVQQELRFCVLLILLPLAADPAEWYIIGTLR